MVSLSFNRKRQAPNGADWIPPSLSFFWWNYRASTSVPQWWLPYIRIPMQSTYQWILGFLGYSIGFTCVWMYIIGIIITGALLRTGWASFQRLQVVGYITFYISVGAGTTINATDGEFLWIVKWSLLNGHSFTLSEIQRILDGDGGFQSIKNLVMGPNRARILTLYLLLTRTGARVGLAFLAASYEVVFWDPNEGRYQVKIVWGSIVGGLILLIVVQSLITFISIFYIKRGSIVPPNTALGLSLALKPCLRPLNDAGGTVSTSKILEALKENDTRYSLQVANVQGASVAQFTLVPGEREPYLTTTQLEKLGHTTKRLIISSNCIISPLIPCILSAAAAVGVRYLLLYTNITDSIETTNIKDIETIVKVKGLGTIRHKLLLSIVLQIYSLFLGAFSDAAIHIVRWGCISSNKTNLTAVESLLAGNNWWSLSSFRFFSVGSRRGWASKIIGAFQARALVSLVGWAALMKYYEALAYIYAVAGRNRVKLSEGVPVSELEHVYSDDIKSEGSYWTYVAISALAASFGMVLAMWILCAGTLAYKKLIPEGNSLPKAHAFRRLAYQLETTGSVDSEVQYGKIVLSTGELATAVSGSAESFIVGTYL
ncbi:hypothetical protein TWF718_005379 [Orbilia javanica]|uniref:Uncharacterized protein n=1 Tax=Orbilia javanica TaxID=47235 RepID=A0AAN8MRW5_9PEZI